MPLEYALLKINPLLEKPFMNSPKSYHQGKLHPHIVVPYRLVHLSNHTEFPLYDTSGPYTESKDRVNIPCTQPKRTKGAKTHADANDEAQFAR